MSSRRAAPTLSPYLMTALVVLGWMTLGWMLRADANVYLLLGIPITMLFQRFVNRRPLRALWVRDAPPFRLDRVGVLIAIALAALPAYALARGASGGIVRIAWMSCGLVGAVLAAYTLRQFRRDTTVALLRCLATGGLLGAVVVVLTWLSRSPRQLDVGALAPDALRWLLLYFPVAFVLEEVFFRGALDAHLHRPGERHPWHSAAFVSVLWALWHLTVVSRPGAAGVLALIVVHVGIGIPLSLYWRRSGNLAVPAASHAAIDAVRNALLG